jgi:hypothetical protein
MSETYHHKHKHSHRHSKKKDEDSVVFMAYDEHGNLVKNTVKKTDLNVPLVDECNFSKKREYPMCLTLNKCALCVRAPRCGWCEKT